MKVQEDTSRSPIKSWSEEDRPREKLLSKGRQQLTDSELLAIIIGSGSVGETALDLSKRILMDHQNHLNELGKISVKDLVKKYKGIGQAKAIHLIAVFELARRWKTTEAKEKIRITSSKDAYDFFYPILSDLKHEEFWVALCNRSNKVIHKELISAGGIHSVLVDTKAIIKIAIDHLASSIILCHNHPSGTTLPSREDTMMTNNIRSAAKLFDITVADHIIIGDKGYFSFADDGL